MNNSVANAPDLAFVGRDSDEAPSNLASTNVLTACSVGTAVFELPDIVPSVENSLIEAPS